MKLLRGIHIFWTFFRYGLDELALSSASHDAPPPPAIAPCP